MTSHDRLGAWIGRVLRVGSIASFVLIGAGLAWALVAGSSSAGARPLDALIAQGGPDAVIAVGVLVLVLAPAAGLVAAAAGLWRRGERARAMLAVAVIGVLAASAALGLLAG